MDEQAIADAMTEVGCAIPSDLTDEEWAPLIAPAKRGGNRRHVVVREVVNGLMYIPEHRLSVAGDR